MKKSMLGVSGLMLAAMAFACSSGSGHPPHADAGLGSGGSGFANSGTGGSNDAAVVHAPCGSFEVGAAGVFNTGTFHGQAWTAASDASTISPAYFDDAAEGAPLCASGTVKYGSNYGYAILGLDINGVLRTETAGNTDAGADGGAAISSWFSLAPLGDGLIVNIDNKAQSALWICIQAVNLRQWCVQQFSNSEFISWSSFEDETGQGPNYANEPLLDIEFTVPDPGSSSGAFNFCINSVVEAASWCACPSGNCSCPAGASACDSTCVLDTSIDPNHCGACNHACASTSACQSGQCHDSLYPDLLNPQGIAIGGNYLYFTDEDAGTVMKAALAGGAPQAIAWGQANPTRLAVDNDNVYWINAGTSAADYLDGAVMKVPVGGGVSPTELAHAQNSPSGITVDANFVYWANWGTSAQSYADGTIMKVPLNGGSMATVASAQVKPTAIAVDASAIYWANMGTSSNYGIVYDGLVMKLGLSETTPTTLVSAVARPTALAVDANNIYFTDSGSVSKVALAGGTVTVLASNQARPLQLVVDGANVYWTNNYAGSIARVPASGGPVVTLASGLNYARSLAVSSTDVYFATSDGAGSGGVLKIAK